jgi:ABC-type dipeptide/oligopeptide/nickel transport system permease component
LVELLAGRLLRMVVTLWVIGTIVFFATRITGNPVDFLMPEGLDATSRKAMIAYWGLDHSYPEQYRRFWTALLRGEFGVGIAERRPVATIMGERIWQSVTLLLSSVTCTILIGIPLGILAAIWRQTTKGTALLVAAFLGYAIPNFVLAISLLLIFSFTLHWLPSSGSRTWLHYIMPTAALSAYFVAALVRYTRNAMLDVMSQDYMRTARAKGLSERMVIFKHGLGNALIPVITILGLQVTTLVSGAVVVETVFSWNGVGDLLVSATMVRDYPVLQFGVMSVAAAVIFVNIAVDLAYAGIDPRVRIAGSRT